jgi:hypothetical protein
MTTYQLQEGRYGENWQNVDDFPRDPGNLDAWIAIGKNMDCHGGKYQYRIVDEQGNAVWQRQEPYEGVSINVFAANPAEWLEDIRRDYGVASDVWRAACDRWLAEVQP